MIGWSPYNAVIPNFTKLIFLKWWDCKHPYSLYLAFGQVYTPWHFAKYMIGSPCCKSICLRHRKSTFPITFYLYPYICILFPDNFVLLSKVTKIIIAHYNHSLEILSNLLNSHQLFLPYFLVPS